MRSDPTLPEPSQDGDEGGDPACWAHLFEKADDDEPDDDESGDEPREPEVRSPRR